MQILEKHTLVHDFPEYQDTIHYLKINDKHFEQLSEQYNELAVELFKLEKNNSPVADKYLESLKMRRVQLKDKLFSLILQSEQKV
jgi:uncharacterized protein YdcH (DUF465 family)